LRELIEVSALQDQGRLVHVLFQPLWSSQECSPAVHCSFLLCLQYSYKADIANKTPDKRSGNWVTKMYALFVVIVSGHPGTISSGYFNVLYDTIQTKCLFCSCVGYLKSIQVGWLVHIDTCGHWHKSDMHKSDKTSVVHIMFTVCIADLDYSM